MRKMDKELIDHIRDNLQSHEEAYTPGAWERFSAPEEKKRSRFIYWPLWSAAAIILVIASVFLLQNNESTIESSVVKTTIPKTKNQENSEKADSDIDKSNSSASVENKFPLLQNSPHTIQNEHSFETKTGEVVSNTTFNKNQGTTLNQFSENNLENPHRLSEAIPQEKINLNSNFSQAQIKLEKRKTPQAKMTFEQLLEQDSHKSNLAKTQKSKTITKWEPGVFVAPSMGNDNKVNMNYGFSLSYNLADKLSISSGIAYSALSTTSNPAANSGSMNDAVADAPSTSNAPSYSSAIAYSSTSKSFESVNASISGINIPLELKYIISSKFYTGVGVSALAILNNKQNNNYLVSSAQNTTVADASGVSGQKMLVVTERVSEPQTGTSTTTDKYIGFYNFSIGYKQKISKKNNFAVEPFLRLPMKTFSNDKLNLTNGGVRLKFDF